MHDWTTVRCAARWACSCVHGVSLFHVQPWLTKGPIIGWGLRHMSDSSTCFHTVELHDGHGECLRVVFVVSSQVKRPGAKRAKAAKQSSMLDMHALAMHQCFQKTCAALIVKLQTNMAATAFINCGGMAGGTWGAHLAKQTPVQVHLMPTTPCFLGGFMHLWPPWGGPPTSGWGVGPSPMLAKHRGNNGLALAGGPRPHH